MDYIWKSVILVLASSILLRVAGRKSLSQMTLVQTVVMFSLSTIIVQPVVSNGMVHTIVAASIFVLSSVIFEFLQLKFNIMERFLIGKSSILIADGKLEVENLKKMRISVDQLEMKLRNKGISRMEDVKTATLEPNGQIGYELVDDARPLTVGEFKKLMKAYLPDNPTGQKNPSNKTDIFAELDGKEQENPEYLQ